MSDIFTTDTGPSSETVWEFKDGDEFLRLHTVTTAGGLTSLRIDENLQYSAEEVKADGEIREEVREDRLLWNNSIDCLSSILLTLTTRGFLKKESDMCEVVEEFLEHLSNAL